MNMPPEITIKLTPYELDQVMNILAEKPYKEVCGVISKVLAQANSPAIQAPPPGAPATPAVPDAGTVLVPSSAPGTP